MKNLLKVVTFAALLGASALAYAGPLIGTLTINGDPNTMEPVNFHSSTTSITFTSTTACPPANSYNSAPCQNDPNFQNEETAGGTGYFNSKPSNGPVTTTKNSNVQYASTVTFTVGAPPATAETFFTFLYAGTPDTFSFTNVVLLGNSLIFYGTLSTGDIAASYTLTPLGGSNPDGSFTSQLAVPPVSPTPEPSSLVLLGTGLVGAAGMMFRRRRNAATV